MLTQIHHVFFHGSREMPFISSIRTFIPMIFAVAACHCLDVHSQTLYVEYGSCAICFQQDQHLLVIELSSDVDGNVKYTSRFGDVGKEGVVSSGFLEDLHGISAPQSDTTIKGGNISVMWSEGNKSSGWLYVDTKCLISILKNGSVEIPLSALGCIRIRR